MDRSKGSRKIYRSRKANHDLKDNPSCRCNIWHQYESRKSELQTLDLTPMEYEAAIRKITEQLGI